MRKQKEEELGGKFGRRGMLRYGEDYVVVWMLGAEWIALGSRGKKNEGLKGEDGNSGSIIVSQQSVLSRTATVAF